MCFLGGIMGVHLKRRDNTVIAICLSISLLISSCQQQEIKVQSHSTAVFLQHIGDSDKSILPIIISDQKISMEVISTVIDELEAYEAHKFQVDGVLLQRITELIHKTDTDDTGHILQITTLNFDQKPRQNRTSFTYNYEQAITVLTGIEQIARSANENKLVYAIGSMKGRLP